MGYWDATDRIQKENGGRNPRCSCGEEMVAVDDHGRFECWTCGGGQGSYLFGLDPMQAFVRRQSRKKREQERQQAEEKPDQDE